MRYRIVIKDAQGNPGYLSFPPSNVIVRKLLAGEDAGAYTKRHVYDGDVVDDIPSLLIPRWKDKGWVEEVADA